MAFHDHTENGITVLQSDLLCGSIRHGFSTRTGGVSPSPWNSLNLGVGRGDDPANVQENFRRLCGVLGLSHQRAVLSKQVHEDNIRLVTESDCGKGLFRQRDYASVDAMICREKHIPLVVFSADCGTILLYDPVQEAIGAVHAGWRGVASGLAAKTVRRMQEAFGTEPGDLLAATGPSIGACCFETDDDVPEAMRRALGAAGEPYMVRRGEESGTIYLSGGRQWRIGSRSAAGCHHHPAFRTACHLLVCPCSPPRCHHHGKIGSLVQGTTGLRGEPSAETTASQYPYF